LETADLVKQELAESAKNFPPGLAYTVAYHPTDYIAASIEAVQHTLVRGDHPSGAGGAAVPSELAGSGDPDHRHPDFPDR